MKFRSLVHTYVNRRRYLKVQACLRLGGRGALSLRGAHPQCKSLPSPPREPGGCGSSEARFLACPLGMEQGGKKCYMERCSQHWAHSELQA